MADTPGTAKVPESFGEKLSFSLPVMILTLVLAIGISYAIIYIVDGNTRKELTETIEKKEKALQQSIAKVDEKAELVIAENKKLTDRCEKLDKKAEQLATAYDKLNTEFGKVAGDFSTFVKTQEGVDKGQSQDIASTAKNLNDVERRTKYIEDKIKLVDQLAESVAGLRKDTNELQAEYKVLKADLTKTMIKADATDKDLTDLSERTKLFQLRVLAARAREAADSARSHNLKELLSRLEDAEGNK